MDEKTIRRMVAGDLLDPVDPLIPKEIIDPYDKAVFLSNLYQVDEDINKLMAIVALCQSIIDEKPQDGDAIVLLGESLFSLTRLVLGHVQPFVRFLSGCCRDYSVLDNK